MRFTLVLSAVIFLCFQSPFVFAEEVTFTKGNYVYRLKIPDSPVMADSSTPICSIVEDDMDYDPPRIRRSAYYFEDYNTESNKIKICKYEGGDDPHWYPLSLSCQIAIEIKVQARLVCTLLLTLDNYNRLLVLKSD